MSDPRIEIEPGVFSGCNLTASDRHIAELEAENERLRALIAAKDEALRRASEDIAGWGSYASDYFKARHNLDGDVEAAKTALALTPADVAERREKERRVIEAADEVVRSVESGKAPLDIYTLLGSLIDAVIALRALDGEK